MCDHEEFRIVYVREGADDVEKEMTRCIDCNILFNPPSWRPL